MNKEDFEDLKQAVIETGQIMRGAQAPSREFIVEHKTSRTRQNPELVWAIYICDEDDALIPLKIYQIEPSQTTNYVGVIDEAGEKLVCPASWFVTIELDSATKKRVSALAHATENAVQAIYE